MPPTKSTHTNASDDSRRTSDGVYFGNDRYRCIKVENGTPCNREMAANNHSISSHNSCFHRYGRHRQGMADGDYKCREDGCDHESPNFLAILTHARRAHGFRGSSRPLQDHYGIPLPSPKKRKNEVEKKSHKKPRHEVKEDGHKEGTPNSKEESRENEPQDSKEDGCEQSRQDGKDEATEEDDNLDDDGELSLIDPRLRKYDRDRDGFGDGDAGNGGSSLLEQILSSNVIAAT